MNVDPNDFPVANRVSSEIISLPMFPQLTLEQLAVVVERIAEFTSLKNTKRPVARERGRDYVRLRA